MEAISEIFPQKKQAGLMGKTLTSSLIAGESFGNRW